MMDLIGLDHRSDYDIFFREIFFSKLIFHEFLFGMVVHPFIRHNVLCICSEGVIV